MTVSMLHAGDLSREGISNIEASDSQAMAFFHKLDSRPRPLTSGDFVPPSKSQY